MEKYDALLLGSGLGGLECGLILARQGMKVCILERGAQIGGCLQTFRRGDTLFDTGFHYVGGLGPGESLHRLFHYFGLLDLPWHRLDEEAFDEVVIGDRSCFFANGHERFVDTLARSFPRQRENLTRYAAFLKNVGAHLYDRFAAAAGDPDERYADSLFAQSAYRFLNETTDDPLLRKMLSGASLKMELNAERLPLYVFAQINHSFIQSAWRLRGGGSQIADRLAQQIRDLGGEIRTRAEVTRLTEAGGRLAEVEVNGEERLAGQWIVSDLHPAQTLSLVEDTRLLRDIYRRRMAALPNTFGMFTAHLRLRPSGVPYRNRNVFIHSAAADLWRPRRSDGSLSSVLVSYYVPSSNDGRDRESATAVDLLTPMQWDEVARWKDLPAGRRGADYAALKARKAAECIAFVSGQIPELRGAIEQIHTSTPLTYHTYTHAVEGAAYGIQKDCTQPLFTVLTPRTPIPNLLLTGQHPNLHGLLGVSMTSFLTCAEILGKETVRQLLRIG